MSPKRIHLLGVPMDCVTMRGAVEAADQAVRHGDRASIFAINPEKIIAARQEPELLAILNSAALLIPDGIGAVIAARVRGVRQIERVPGSELMPELCELARLRGYGIYLFGGRPEVNRDAAQRLAEQFPGLKILGRHHGYVDEEEQPALLEDINRSGAQILFVALGSPRQEYWIANNMRHMATVKILQGVGERSMLLRDESTAHHPFGASYTWSGSIDSCRNPGESSVSRLCFVSHFLHYASLASASLIAPLAGIDLHQRAGPPGDIRRLVTYTHAALTGQ